MSDFSLHSNILVVPHSNVLSDFSFKWNPLNPSGPVASRGSSVENNIIVW